MFVKSQVNIQEALFVIVAVTLVCIPGGRDLGRLEAARVVTML